MNRYSPAPREYEATREREVALYTSTRVADSGEKRPREEPGPTWVGVRKSLPNRNPAASGTNSICAFTPPFTREDTVTGFDDVTSTNSSGWFGSSTKVP